MKAKCSANRAHLSLQSKKKRRQQFAQKERLGTQIVTVFTLIDSPQKNDVLVFDNFTVQ